MPSTIIVGAGWAGLSCAYTLTRAGHTVTLIDAAPQFGGRARAVQLQDCTIDNGQHICLGAYHTLRQILKELNLEETQLFKILAMELIAYGDKKIHLKLPKLPAPYNLLIGIFRARHIPWLEKYRVLKFCYDLFKIKFVLAQDCTLIDLLKNYHQSDFIIKHLWEPIALAAMTTPINQASAQIFINILHSVFAKQQKDSNWYLPAIDLSSILPTHLENFLISNGSELIYAQAIKQLDLSNNQCCGVSSSTKNWQADNVVLAMSPWQASVLLQPHTALIDDHQALTNFSYQPITTIYFAFDKPVNLEYPMIGMLNSVCHWVFDRAFVGQPNMISAVISGPGAHQQLMQNDLANTVLKEIQQRFTHVPTPIWQRVINEKRAAFSCSMEIQKYRPQSKTGISNLWLTGDYLQTGLPATLEGALVSGSMTAESILNISPRSNQNC